MLARENMVVETENLNKTLYLYDSYYTLVRGYTNKTVHQVDKIFILRKI